MLSLQLLGATARNRRGMGAEKLLPIPFLLVTTSVLLGCGDKDASSDDNVAPNDSPNPASDGPNADPADDGDTPSMMSLTGTDAPLEASGDSPGPSLPVTSSTEDPAPPEQPSGQPPDAEPPGSEPAPSGDASAVVFVENVEVAVHDDVNTILIVTWEQVVPSERVWLEFNIAGEDAMRSPPGAGGIGPHRDVVLGVPGATEVEIRVVNLTGEQEVFSAPVLGITDPLPAGMPQPEILAHDRSASSPEQWLLGSVEDSNGNLPADYLIGTFWVYIMDRQGRIVWYYADPASNATTSFQRVAKDGEYLWLEKRPFGQAGTRSVVKMTLDRTFYEEIPVEGLADCIDVTEDGSLLYDASDQLRQMDPQGEVRVIFNCREHFGQNFNCYTNTINHVASNDTVLMSYPEPSTVIQVRRTDGEVVGQYGDAADSWAFATPSSSPPEQWGFGFQHFPNITQDGTLLVSTHLPGYEDFETMPGDHQHAFVEFELDRANERLVEVWRYTEGPEWPRSRGMVVKLANGNYLGNYGTHGVIREVTADKQTVFHVKFDHDGDNDYYNKLVGNNEYIADLYALNGGPVTGGDQ